MSPRDLVYVGHMLDTARKAVSKTQGISRESYDADENLRLACVELADDPVRWDRLVRSVYEHFCTMLLLMVQLPRRYHINSWRRYLDMDQGGPLVAALLSGRPLLMVTGHFGNWELGGYTLGVFGFPSYAIARRIDNPYLDRYYPSPEVSQ